MQRILITGANRGLGLEFVRQYLARGERVFAACRTPKAATELQALAAAHPNQLTVLALDVSDSAAIEAADTMVKAHTAALDLLINNAAIAAKDERFGQLDAETMLQILAVNSVAPTMVAQRFAALLKAGNTPKLINISSGLGSIARRTSGGSYSYCTSKATLNMITRLISFDLALIGVTAIVLHPGWVQTDMGGKNATLTPGQSIAGMLQVIDGLTPKDSGRFLQWDGGELPW